MLFWLFCNQYPPSLSVHPNQGALTAPGMGEACPREIGGTGRRGCVCVRGRIAGAFCVGEGDLPPAAVCLLLRLMAQPPGSGVGEAAAGNLDEDELSAPQLKRPTRLLPERRHLGMAPDRQMPGEALLYTAPVCTRRSAQPSHLPA